MKLMFTALMVIASSALTAHAAPAKICGNGWTAVASCANDPEHYIHICLDPSQTDGSAVVHTLDVKTTKITEEVGAVYVSSKNQMIVVETDSPTFKNLTMQRMTATTFGGARDYRPGVMGKPGDLTSFFCKVNDQEVAKIPVR